MHENNFYKPPPENLRGKTKSQSFAVQRTRPGGVEFRNIPGRGEYQVSICPQFVPDQLYKSCGKEA